MADDYDDDYEDDAEPEGVDHAAQLQRDGSGKLQFTLTLTGQAADA